MSSPMDMMTVSVKREPLDHLSLNQSVASRVKLRRRTPVDTMPISLKQEPEDHLYHNLKVKKSSPVKQEPEDHLDINLKVKKSSPRPARSVSVKQEPEDHLDIKQPEYSWVKESSPVPSMTPSVEQEPEDHLDISNDHQLTLQQDRTDEPLTSKSIWIVGSNIIAQAKSRIEQTLGRHFGLPAEVSWLLKRDMRWRDVILMVQEQLSTSPPPDILLIHAGGNDLGKVQMWTLVKRMQAELLWLHSRYENIKIVFSGIVARQRWEGARRNTKLNKARTWVNRQMIGYVRWLSGEVIHHNNITGNQPGLFLQDGVHLTNRGQDILIDDLYNGLRGLYTETH